MILLVPVGDAVHAVNADRVITVERDKTHLRVRVDFGGYMSTYVLEADEYSIGLAWTDFLAHFDLPHYQVDLTWLKQSPAPEAVASGD
jgi:hypothetical protein